MSSEIKHAQLSSSQCLQETKQLEHRMCDQQRVKDRQQQKLVDLEHALSDCHKLNYKTQEQIGELKTDRDNLES